MIIHFAFAVAAVAVAYAIYKHIGLSAIEADVKTAVAKAEAFLNSTASASTIVSTIKADLKKYL